MGKKILLFIISLFIITGCSQVEPFKIEDEYYGSGTLISKEADEVEQMLANKESFILFTYNNFCSLPLPCEDIFADVAKNEEIGIVQIPFGEFKKTSLHDEVKLAPSVLIIQEGEIVTYLKADKDKDFDKYQDEEDFTAWLEKYIILDLH